MKGTNDLVTWIGGVGTLLTTIGATGIGVLPEYKTYCLICTVLGGGLTAMAFYLAKGKDSTGTTGA